MSFNFLLLYLLTVFIASILPGPSMLLALTHGMHYGVRKTIASAMGNMSVTLIQASISIAGLGTILLASETLFSLIKWAGAVYLISIGISMLFSAKKMVLPSGYDNSIKGHSLKKMYFQAALVTAGNPKAIVFFTAVFPQFLDSNAPYLMQSIVLLGGCALISFGCFMGYAIFGQKIVSVFSTASVRKYVNRVLGGSFIGAGIGLALGNR